MITKKHFKAIAEIINKEYNLNNGDAIFSNEQIIKFNERGICIQNIVNNLSNYFKTLNLDFDEDKFKKACLK